MHTNVFGTSILNLELRKMIDWQKLLTYHGQSKDICELVIANWDKPEYIKLETVRLWVEASKACLKEKHNV
jgi:hypothetical protein